MVIFTNDNMRRRNCSLHRSVHALVLQNAEHIEDRTNIDMFGEILYCVKLDDMQRDILVAIVSKLTYLSAYTNLQVHETRKAKYAEFRST